MPRRRRRIDPLEVAIAKRLKELRENRGVTQTELARKVGIHQSVLSECERGSVRLHGALLVRLARALKVSADVILALEKAERSRPVNGRLLRRLERIDALPRFKQRVVLEMVDAFLEKHSRSNGRPTSR